MGKLKWGLGLGILAAVLVVGTALALQPQLNPAKDKNEAACSVAGVAGEWGYSVTGTLLPPTGAVPFAIVGRAAFNADGTFSGTQTSNAGGTVGDEATSGTLTVNSDCTGTFTVNILDQSGKVVRVASWATVHAENQTAARGVLKSLEVNGNKVPAVLSITESRLFPDGGDKK